MKKKGSAPKKAPRLRVIPTLLILAFVMVGGILFIEGQSGSRRPEHGAVGGDFVMTDHKGRAVTEADFSDKPMAIFFGYTFCPDVCPTTLWEMSQWVEDLGDDAKDMHFVFVSVDVERDDQDMLASYVHAFFDDLVGLHGTEEQTQNIIKAYRVYAKSTCPRMIRMTI